VPFIAMRTEPPIPGVCSSCGESGRVWRFGEEALTSKSGYTLSVSHALCAACIEVVVSLVDEDDD